jgi:hypothetical protein
MASINYLAHLELNKNEIRKAVIENLASAPSSPVAGQVYFNTTDNAPYIYSGSAWVRIDGDITDVQGTAPIAASVNATTGVATVSISAATTSAAGSLSAADKTKLDNATANNTVSTLVLRDSSGNFSAADPTSAQHVATKAYVDGVASGIDVKASVKAATTANITLSGAQTIDGVSIVSGDRVLVKDQSTASENGIYVAAASSWTRATDMDNWAEVPGAFTFVEQGTTNADSGWVCTSDQGGTIGSTNITWSQFSGAGQVTAGAGMTKTGNTLDVVAADNSLTVNADSLQVKVDDSTIKVTTSGIYVPGYTPVASANVARTREFTSISVGDSPGTQTLTHNLGTRSVTVRVYDDTTYEELYCEVKHSTTNTVTVAANGATRTVRVLVVG